MIQCMAFAVHTWNCKKQGLVTCMYMSVYIFFLLINISLLFGNEGKYWSGFSKSLKICQLNLKL